MGQKLLSTRLVALIASFLPFTSIAENPAPSGSASASASARITLHLAAQAVQVQSAGNSQVFCLRRVPARLIMVRLLDDKSGIWSGRQLNLAREQPCIDLPRKVQSVLDTQTILIAAQ